MAKRKIVEIDGKKYVSIPLTKKVLIEGKIVDKGTRLLVEEEGVVDTIQTDADIASASSSDFDEIYTMRRPFARMDADDFAPETPVAPVDDPNEFLSVMDDEEKFELRRRIRSKMDKKDEDKDKMDKNDEEDKSEMRRRLARMRARMDDKEDDKDKMDKEEDKDKLDKDEEDKNAMRARMRARMISRMDKEDKDKMDKDDDKKE